MKINRYQPGKKTNSLADLRNLVDQHYRNRNLSSLISTVHRLQKQSGVLKEELAQAFKSICELALDQGKKLLVFNWALKIFTLDLPSNLDKGNLYSEARDYLLAATEDLSFFDQETEKKVVSCFKAFIADHLKVIDLEKLPSSEKIDWLFRIHKLFPHEFLNEQLYLADEVFSHSRVAEIKCDAASIYLTSARRNFLYHNRKVDSQKVREKAEFLLSTSIFFSLIPIIDKEVFATIMVDLGCYRLFDLQEKLLTLRNPPKDDLVWTYWQLLTTLQNRPIDEAYQEVFKAVPLVTAKKTSSIMEEEIKVLSAEITREYLESKKKRLLELVIPRETLPWFERTLLQPRSLYPKIQEKIKQLRYEIFSGGLQEDLINGHGHLFVACELPSLLGREWEDSFLISLFRIGALELYLPDLDGKFFKMRHLFNRDHQERPRSISADLVFESLKEEEVRKVSLFWEYFSLTMLTQTIIHFTSKREKYSKGLEEITEMISRSAFFSFLKENGQIYDALERKFLQTPDYQNFSVELDNRFQLSKKIFALSVSAIESKASSLQASDPLFPLIEEIKIVPYSELKTKFCDFHRVPPQEINSLLGVSSGLFPFGVVFKTREGKSFWAIMENLNRIKIPGKEEGEKSNFYRYLQGLVLEAIVKPFAADAKSKKTTGEGISGYVIDRAGLFSKSNLERALDYLAKIYKKQLYEQFRKRGLLPFSWYYYRSIKNDGLYLPLENQSGGSKRKALENLGPANLFIPVEASGLVERLRVGLKRDENSKELKLDAWERNPLREEQQKLLGDTQSLKTYYGLCIVTIFSNGCHHVYLYALREKEEEILADDLLTKIEDEVRAGNFRDPKRLLRKTIKEKRETLKNLLASGEITIMKQKAELYELQTTFRRPQFESISSLQEKGFPLEV